MFCFGPHASTAPAESMARAPAVDGMFVGEPEDGVLQLARCRRSTRSARFRQPDVAPRTAASCRTARTAAFSGFLQTPHPAWDLLDLDAATRCRSSTGPTSSSRPAAAARTRCDFCVAPIHQGHKFRERSAKALVDEIERSYRELGVEFFYLWGDTVTLNVKSFTAFCDELIARKLPIQWFGNARADNLTDPAFVHRLQARRAAGCSRSASRPSRTTSARTW